VRLLSLALLCCCWFTTLPAQAGTVLDRVRAQKTLRCGAEARPGLISVDAEGHARGLLLDLCRAVAVAVLPPDGRLEFNLYDSSKDFDAVRNATDDLFFLTASEMLEEKLTDKVVPGPTVFNMSTNVMVPTTSSVRSLGDLADKSICLSQGTNAHRHAEAWFAQHKLGFQRMGYQEDVELFDAYRAQACLGLASEVTTLADIRRDRGVRNIDSVILPEPLAVFPLMAATSTQDGLWSSLVAWTMHTVIRADVPAAAWRAGGVDALSVSGASFGLQADWQKRVLDTVGTYGDMFDRNLGNGSPYKLPRGVNAQLIDGGLMLAPYDE
jgi:general L-amino acid transport system substrate-binding protein